MRHRGLRGYGSDDPSGTTGGKRPIGSLGEGVWETRAGFCWQGQGKDAPGRSRSGIFLFHKRSVIRFRTSTNLDKKRQEPSLLFNNLFGEKESVQSRKFL